MLRKALRTKVGGFFLRPRTGHDIFLSHWLAILAPLLAYKSSPPYLTEVIISKMEGVIKEYEVVINLH